MHALHPTRRGGGGEGDAGGGGAFGYRPVTPPCVTVHRVVVDSRERDLRVYPNPATYEVQLASELRNVVSVRLASADVPFSSLLLGPRHTRLPFLWWGGGVAVQLSAQLLPGNYASGAALAAELARALNEAVASQAGGSGAEVLVVHDARADALRVRATAAFELLPLGAETGRTSALARVLGLPHLTSVLSATTPDPSVPSHPELAIAPFRVNLEPDRYVVLHMTPNADVLSSTQDALHRGFAVIPITVNQSSIAQTHTAMEKVWSPPVARVSRLGFKFLDYEGNPYAFENRDHHLELVFTCTTGGHALGP